MLHILHNFVIPILLGLGLTALKVMADQRDYSLNEANGVALDLVLVSIGALGAFYMQGRSVEASYSAGAGDAFIAVVLLVLRYTRVRKYGKVVSYKKMVGEVGLLAGIFELLLGLSSIYWTVYAQ